MKKSLPCAYRECEEKINTETFGMEDKACEKRRILLHSCCGPCSTACIERLLPDYKVTIFYYNPNITDRDEYEKRKVNQIKFIEAFNETVPEEDKVVFIEGEYLPEDFFDVAQGLEDCPEGGERCTECFKLRLDRTAKAALAMGYPIFGTTLTVSPHKNFPLISGIGAEVGEEVGIDYLPYDFKKKDGFLRSIQLSKEFGLYRQDYCGCNFSKR